jgi:hypothetical protein
MHDLSNLVRSYLMETGNYNITARLMPFVNCLPSLRLMRCPFCLPFSQVYALSHLFTLDLSELLMAHGRGICTCSSKHKQDIFFMTIFFHAEECIDADKMQDKCKETMHANQRIYFFTMNSISSLVSSARSFSVKNYLLEMDSVHCPLMYTVN